MSPSVLRLILKSGLNEVGAILFVPNHNFGIHPVVPENQFKCAGGKIYSTYLVKNQLRRISIPINRTE